MRALILLALLSSIPSGCVRVPRPDPQYGVVRVAFGTPLDDADPWLPDEIVELRREIGQMQALGPAFVETDEGNADVVLRPFDSKAADPRHKRCGADSARYHPGSDYAEIDTDCTQGYDQLRSAAGHELGHFLGLPHICADEESDPTCDPRWRGEAVMNPDLSYDVEDQQLEPAAGMMIGTQTPTSLDVAAFHAVRNNRTHYSAALRSIRHRIGAAGDAAVSGADASAQ